MFTEQDLYQFSQKGIRIAQVEQQIKKFQNGFKFIQLSSAARIADGMLRFEDNEVEELISFYKENAGKYKVVKFVPASGAASRMFKLLFNAMETLDNNPDEKTALFEDRSFNSVAYFFENLEKFAFYTDLKELFEQKGETIEAALENQEYAKVLHNLLDDDGLNYGKLPKALLRFHSYAHGSRYAIEEHLVEGVYYACDQDGNVFLHFTVSPEHIMLVSELMDELVPSYEEAFKVKFDIEYSIQKPETDTIAVDLDNQPFRLDNGEILFRPAGHGALIENLNDLDYDIAYIKNIDNIVPDHLRESTYVYKQVIGALLIKRMQQVNSYLGKIEGNDYTEQWLKEELIPFIEEKLMISLPDHFLNWNTNKQAEYIANKLNRPIRVCGMVKNEGEPGGGPFLVDSYGELSLQIVEKSQINEDDPKQMEILNNATHFNPVDLVCSLKDYQGNAFDLTSFVDDDTSFISEKSQQGRQLKALELPGLWNGAMADWITIFVEVPIETFNPVKVVNDLLREQHQ